MTDKPRGLRSGLTNYGDKEFSSFLRRSFVSSMGFGAEMLERPVVGICQTGSDFNNCHRTMPELVEAVKRGVLAAGGLPLVFPVISLGEASLFPTSLYFRNLMSMDVEEMVRGQPIDAVVAIGGCDKTVPAQLMGMASADIPSVQLVTGPMSTGRFEGERVAACTDCRRFWARYRAGEARPQSIKVIEQRLAPTAGTCGVMGTASTMAAVAEALGMMPVGSAAAPAVTADRLRIAEQTGNIAVSLIGTSLVPSRIMTKAAFENALRVLLAIAGSTNAIIHLTAIAGRLGVKLSPETLNAISDTTPVLVDLKPTGVHYMEDFAAAGGIPAVMRELKHLLNLDCVTVTGETIGERLAKLDPWVDRRVVRSVDAPLQAAGGLVALFGSLAPGGAILKRAAADPALLESEGTCLVFDSLEDMAQRIDDPELEVDERTILVLRNAGPASDSAMPEAGYIPIPSKLAKRGIKDMIRISDARMSGTAYGTIVLHVTPDSAAGGPLSLVRTGDQIRLSVAERRIDILVPSETLAQRQSRAQQRSGSHRGYAWLHKRFVTQADQGCDFSFLTQKGITEE